MAKKKCELEAEWNIYMVLADRMHQAECDGRFYEAVQFAKESCEYIDGMMRYARRYREESFSSIATIDLILKYAPPLLDHQGLVRLDGLLLDCRRIEKNTSSNLGSKIAQAREEMWRAHRLWNHLANHTGVVQDQLCASLGGRQDAWRVLVEKWERLGLVRREREGASHLLFLVTRMGEIVFAKCPECGVTTEAPKSMVLEPMSCSDCGKESLFVLVARDVRGER